MKVNKATAKDMLEVSKGWDSNADIGGEEVEEAFTEGFKQGRIKAFEEIRNTMSKNRASTVSDIIKFVIDDELKKARE